MQKVVMIFKWHNTNSLYWSFFFANLALFLIKLKPGRYKDTIQHKEILCEKGILVRGGGGGVESSY